MGNKEKALRFGWFPDWPDARDLNLESDKFKGLLDVEKKTLKVALPPSADLEPWCSPVEDQGNLGSCTANAAVGLVEYYEKRKFGKYLDASKLFLYKATRNLLGWTGDTGAFIRTTVKALRLFGVCPEDYWRYTDRKPDFDMEPPAFCYAFAANYQAISYFRLDTPELSTPDLLTRIKICLTNAYPIAFGFTVYSSIYDVSDTGDIPFPKPGDIVLGGHAVVAVGYDDGKKALKIRNSWGKDWGKQGYGTLPYDYVLKGLSRDFWILLKQEWIDLGQFE